MRDIRLNMGLTLRDVESKTGVSRQTVKLIEDGVTKYPGMDTCDALAKLYGIKPEDVMAHARQNIDRDDRKDIALNCKELKIQMIRQDYDNKKLAKEIDITQAYLGHILAGRMMPSKKIRKRILTVLDLPWEFLFEIVE